MGFLSNYLRNLAAIAVGREPVRPLLFSYYITHRCALRCCYCSDGAGRPFKEDLAEELSTGDACRLITMLRRCADTLDITGGEPLVRDDLEAVLAHGRSVGFRTVLNTKGLGLRERPAIVESVDVLVLSIDSLQPETLARLTGQPAAVAEEMLGTLHWLLENRSKWRARLVLAAVATPDNSEEVAGVLRFAERNGLGFQVSPEIVGTLVHDQLRDNRAFHSLMDEIIAAKRRSAGVLGVCQYLHGARNMAPFRCHPLLMPTIRPDGGMYYPCLEAGRAPVNVLEAGGYGEGLRIARSRCGPVPACRGKCHLFCHMALSLLQQHPLTALAELRSWGALTC